MKLSTWIDQTGGTVKSAAALNVKRNVVYAWRKGVAMPRPFTMQAIVKHTRGKVSYDEIINEYRTKREEGKAKKKAKTPKPNAKVLKTLARKSGKTNRKAATASPAKKKSGTQGARKRPIHPGF